MSLDAVSNALINPKTDSIWELFHENSKMSWYDLYPIAKQRLSELAIVSIMRRLHQVKPFKDAPQIPLPEELPVAERSFDDVLRYRTSAREFSGDGIRLDQLAKVLFMSYGITRDNAGTNFPRPFRTVPSGGALYPLDIYVYASRVSGLDAGLYHYNPETNTLEVLRKADEIRQISGFFVQGDLALKAAAVLFVAATFSRTVFKYGDRGYRFVLLETGHLAQNSNLTAQEMGLATTNIGGYTDRDVDRYLGLDGVNESTVYLLLIGHPSAENSEGRTEQIGDVSAAAQDIKRARKKRRTKQPRA
jgi:SagB-type dehydrogenase family enzyme